MAGGEDEPVRYVTEVSRWITAGGGPQGVAPWVDPVDGFDYHEAAEKLAAYVRAGSRGGGTGVGGWGSRAAAWRAAQG